MFGLACDVKMQLRADGGSGGVDPAAAVLRESPHRPIGLIRPGRPAVGQGPGPDIHALQAHAALAAALPHASSEEIQRLVAAGFRGAQDL